MTIEEAGPSYCNWTEDPTIPEVFHADCGDTFSAMIGTPIDNHMEYCCFCGLPLIQMTPRQSEPREPANTTTTTTMNELTTTNGDIQAAIEAGRQIGERVIQTINGIPVLVAREDVEHQPLEQLLDHPIRMKGTVNVTDEGSFIAYHNAFADDTSLITCDTKNGVFTSHLDYHSPGGPASHDDHRLVFAVRRTDEWETWTGKSGCTLTQAQFAEFIEDNLDEIRVPDGATMLEVAQTISGTQAVKFTRGVRLHNGQQQIEFVEDLDGQAGARGNLQIPELFVLAIEPFEGADPYELTARFRYRIRNNELSMSYHLHRPAKVLEAAIEETATNIRRQAKCQLLINN